MRLALHGLVVGTLARAVTSAGTTAPRGVGPEFVNFYASSDDFTCISNPSVHLPLGRVNDNFCDCPDGSDEPGTSACAHLSSLSPQYAANPSSQDLNTTLALPGYFCRNKGHNSNYIPFTHVNDGICDYDVCCDGSDEWENIGGAKCPDRCKELGKKWREQDERRKVSLTNAAKRRKELVTDAARQRVDIDNFLQTSRSQVEGLERQVSQLEKDKDDIERRERSRVVKSTGQSGKASILAGLAKTRLTQVREALIDTRAQRDAHQQRLAELEAIMTTFKDEYNPNFNDEGVKRAVRAWEDFVAKEHLAPPEEAKERDLDEMTTGIDGIPWEDFEAEEETELDVLYQFEEYLPGPLRDWLDQKLRDLRVMLIENGILPNPAGEGATESKALKEAKDRLSSAQNDLNSMRQERATKEEDLKKDYGADDVFRSLKGTCTSLDSGEYTYELCWMDKVTQKPKKGGAQNNMGNFERFDTIIVDEEVSADGKGVGSGERVAMKYENGAHCWQGPNRSTTVVIACAEHEEVWKVMEDEKCVYSMHVGSPAVCRPPVTGDGQGVGVTRDEL
ncbi:MAG: hypothetical protein M1828_005775 [Chrysothrix sp. TS-e1954]|nr:MAG: hypothetical protein M1828_005775 [Chrysothrix sp. TS-e1954]